MTLTLTAALAGSLLLRSRHGDIIAVGLTAVPDGPIRNDAAPAAREV
jgi:hypothetical protein